MLAVAERFVQEEQPRLRWVEAAKMRPLRGETTMSDYCFLNCLCLRSNAHTSPG